ncbi:hypothetical protein Baya_2545 [Bagarius yarrelli]|uniref:Hematopoietic progenitor cell antigen CD34 n=1 Tax=Bagarius yarrelli TaxID=175774 RepID=A0A556VXT1_BAGYA|nr:hypothetical protein Baya_2545 [Bagarius yarrelli]
MEGFNWKQINCRNILALASVMYTVLFQGVACQENAITHISTEGIPNIMANVRGDNIPPTPADPGLTKSQQLVEIPEIADVFTTVESSTKKIITPAISRLVQGQVECVNEAAVRDKDAVKLTLKIFSSCEENKAKIQSILEHLCGNSSKLEIYQRDHTNEMIISGDCVEGDVKGMTDRFDNDNIRDKVGVLEAEPILVNQSQTVLISILIAGLLLAALLFAVYFLKTCNTTAKEARLAEELFQVDEPNQGNTLLSVAPLPPQEPVEKPTSNGESLDSPPTNGHSASQAPVADSEM